MKTETEVIPYGAMERSDLSIARDPELIVVEARRAAQVLKDVISKKDKPVKFNGEQYLEFEDWQTVGKFYGITAKVLETKFIDYGGAQGFEARAVAVTIANGVEVSAADAMCLNDEANWGMRAEYDWENGKKVKIGERPVPLFQLRSMAQTRACGKALRNVLAWVVVLAGYRPNVAEEMTGLETAAERPQKTQGKVISENQAKRFFAICRGNNMTTDQINGLLKQYGFEKDRDITVEKYDEIVKKAQGFKHDNTAA